jgi:hypothetical protein|tara:strand:- start:1326 stop:1598 length:273 start_codon:yes stop_codon:yes gene_type:complete
MVQLKYAFLPHYILKGNAGGTVRHASEKEKGQNMRAHGVPPTQLPRLFQTVFIRQALYGVSLSLHDTSRPYGLYGRIFNAIFGQMSRMPQ